MIAIGVHYEVLALGSATSDLTQIREVFNGNLNLFARFLPMYMKFVESLFYISQYATFKVLFATVRALETGHIIHNEKLAIAPINVLGLPRLKSLRSRLKTMFFP